MKKYEEPSEKQNLKTHYDILYANFIARCCFVMKKHNKALEKQSLKNTSIIFCI